MLCVTIARTRHKLMLAEHKDVAASGAKLVELRLDYIGRSIDLPRLLKNRPTAVVVTCRRKADGGRWERSEEERLMLLRQSIAMGVEYVDLEEDIASKIPRYGKTKRIVSVHNFEGTPDHLESIHERLSQHDTDIVKLAVTAHSFSDAARMLRLMRSAKVPTIGISMGEYGSLTRLLATRYGAPFTFCVYNIDRRVAPGQFSFHDMKELFRVDSIGPNTRLFGVVADPIAHSLSPLLHNKCFENHQLDYRYIPFRVAPADLESFLHWCEEENIGGLSVTIPHKQSVMPYLTHVESAAQGIAACNTIAFVGKQLAGYNTDYRASMDCLSEAIAKTDSRPNPFENKSVLLLGSGGVARAIGYGLAQRQASITVAGRNHVAAEELAKNLNGKWIAWEDRHLIQPSILVNCTPIGMFPEVDSSPYTTGKLHEETLVFDTVYNPEQTLLIKGARAQGCSVITGLQMFVRQAAYQYRLFTGLEPPVELMVKTVKLAISPLNYNLVDDSLDDEDSSIEKDAS
jgi:3-dehydroquinate dehydratase/shikimate dehydrogenase